MITALGLLGVFALVVATGYFVAAEFSYVVAKKSRLAEMESTGNKRAGTALRVMRELNFMLSGAQFGITVLSLLLGFLAEPVMARILKPGLEWLGLSPKAQTGVGVFLALMIVTVLQMVVGELAPKIVAVARPESVAIHVARPLQLFLVVAHPIITLFDGAANRLLRLLGIHVAGHTHTAVSIEELELMVLESAKRGELSPEQAKLLHRALDFTALRASAAKVPWNKVATVPPVVTGARLRELMGHSHSRYPVVGDDGRVTHIVHIKDVLKVDDADDAVLDLTGIGTPALVVPELAQLGTVLDEMRETNTEMAVLADEYGAPAGIITLEDLIEELVGEIGDEYDVAADEPRAVRLADGWWSFPGTMRVDEVDRATSSVLPEEQGYDTVAGLILERLQRMPRVGDEITAGDQTLRVAALDEWAITEVHMSPVGRISEDRT